MNKENSITINGIKHHLVENKPHEGCLECSLQSLCDYYLCEALFGIKGQHFEILKQE